MKKTKYLVLVLFTFIAQVLITGCYPVKQYSFLGKKEVIKDSIVFDNSSLNYVIEKKKGGDSTFIYVAFTKNKEMQFSVLSKSACLYKYHPPYTSVKNVPGEYRHLMNPEVTEIDDYSYLIKLKKNGKLKCVVEFEIKLSTGIVKHPISVVI